MIELDAVGLVMWRCVSSQQQWRLKLIGGRLCTQLLIGRRLCTQFCFVFNSVMLILWNIEGLKDLSILVERDIVF